MSLASVVLTNVSKSFGPVPVLDAITFTLGPHTRMGVVGRNGSGKSTLLRLIAGIEMADEGSIVLMPPGAAIGYLAQQMDRSDESVDEYLLRRSGVSAAIESLERTATALSDGTDEAFTNYEMALERFNSSGAADFEARVPGVLQNVGLAEEFRSQAMRTLSGGQAAKVSLASTLLSQFDLLLLDEPTNDLDFRGLELLEEFVTRSSTGMLLVSHDRAFIERTTTSILEIDEHHHTAREFGGGWEAYERERRATQGQAEQRYDNFVSQKQQLKDRAQQQRQWSDKGVRGAKSAKDNDKFVKNWGAAKSEQLASKARTTEKAIERLEVVDKPWEGWRLQMQLGVAPRAGDVVAKLTDAVVRRGTFTLGPMTEEISWAERVAIVGPNGAGKSTLLRALLGTLPLTSGTQYLGPGVVIGEIDQLRSVLGSDAPLIDAFVTASSTTVAESRSLLAKFDLGAEHVLRPAASLSPGEQTRTLLALLMSRNTNLLVLDEPTNHLDVDAIEQLEAALETYNGTILLVTHDRRMLDSVTITRRIDLGQ